MVSDSIVIAEDLGLGEETIKHQTFGRLSVVGLATEEHEETWLTWKKVKEDFGRHSVKDLVAKEGEGTLGLMW